MEAWGTRLVNGLVFNTSFTDLTGQARVSPMTATLRRLVWPVQSEEVGRERIESARNPFGVQGK